MQINKKPFPLTTINGMKARINTNPDFQRPAVWSTSQKQLLVDTILRGYDVPKLYWRRLPKVDGKPDRYDVVDGQQRLRAIWSFFQGEFKCDKGAEPIDGVPIATLKYDELPDDLRSQFDIYPLDIVVLEAADDDEVREMFVRLQNGTTLKAQEKRNAYPGKMREFVRSLTTHPFFTRVGFANARLTYDLIAAQLVCLEIAGGPTNVKNADLNRMYEEHRDFDLAGAVAKAVRKKLDTLASCFPEKTPELERYSVIALFCVISELMAQFVFSQAAPSIQGWFIAFETQRRAQDALDEEHAEPEWVAYKEKISHSTDAADSIRARMDFMLRHFLAEFPELPRKDNQRAFTHQQKLAVFRRDKGICQVKMKCDGAKLTWDEWECDHKLAWSKGGKTTVENAQVACPACNAYKSDSVLATV
jgi:hypothetical protein